MRSVFAILCAVMLFAAPARAQTAEAEAFVTSNITTALTILNDASLGADARATRLESHLLGLTDMPRVALFTLGPAAAGASAAQRDAFTAAFRDYALAAWRSQFMLFLGGNMAVTGSHMNAPGDVLVRTMVTNSSMNLSLPLDFRVRTDGPKPVIIDIGFAGIWLAVTQRDDFAAYLARNKGDIGALTTWLAARAKTLR